MSVFKQLQKLCDAPFAMVRHEVDEETDFRILWHRPGRDGAPSSLLAIGGRRLELERRAPLELPAAVRYLSLPLDREPRIVPAEDTSGGEAERSSEVVTRWLDD